MPTTEPSDQIFVVIIACNNFNDALDADRAGLQFENRHRNRPEIIFYSMSPAPESSPPPTPANLPVAYRRLLAVERVSRNRCAFLVITVNSLSTYK